MFYEPRTLKDQKWASYLICDRKWHVNTLKKYIGINYSYNLIPILTFFFYFICLKCFLVVNQQDKDLKFLYYQSNQHFFPITQNLVFPDGLITL